MTATYNRPTRGLYMSAQNVEEARDLFELLSGTPLVDDEIAWALDDLEYGNNECAANDYLCQRYHADNTSQARILAGLTRIYDDSLLQFASGSHDSIVM